MRPFTPAAEAALLLPGAELRVRAGRARGGAVDELVDREPEHSRVIGELELVEDPAKVRSTADVEAAVRGLAVVPEARNAIVVADVRARRADRDSQAQPCYAGTSARGRRRSSS